MRIASFFAALALGSLVVLGLACSPEESSTSSSGSSDDASSSDTSSSTASSGQGGGGGATTGQGGATSSSGGGGAPPCPGLGDACTECLAWQCSDLYCGCYDNPTCGTLVECLQTCGPNNPDCTNGCLGQNSDGISDAFLVGDCSATTCLAECPNTGVALAPCEKCLFSKCENEMNTCVAIPDCTGLIGCIQDCAPGDQLCAGGCAIQFPAVSEATAVGDCSKAQCPSECAM